MEVLFMHWVKFSVKRTFQTIMSITRQKICFHRSGSTLQISRFNLTQMQILSITSEHIVDDSFHPQINENTTEIF